MGKRTIVRFLSTHLLRSSVILFALWLTERRVLRWKHFNQSWKVKGRERLKENTITCGSMRKVMKRAVLLSSLLLSAGARRAVTSSPTPAPAQSELYSLHAMLQMYVRRENSTASVRACTKTLPAGLEWPFFS